MSNFRGTNTISTGAYINAWQKRRASRERQITCFRLILVGTLFTLPGGLTRQTKLSPRQAQAEDGRLVACWPWEEVVPV
jgi:hypothetical protein